MAIIKEERIGGQRLIFGDCLEVMPLLGEFDAVVTDPPYGIGEDGGAQRTRGKKGYSKHKKKYWDKKRPPKECFDTIISCSNEQIIWGGNYFCDWLPPSMGWLYWQKRMGGDFSDGELAWTSRQKALKEFTKCPKGMDKAHPCEKPLVLIEWCLSLIPNAETILDPFMGSGTTLVSCEKLGRMGTGIELDPDYFDIACKRVDEATRQHDLFVEPPAPQPTQRNFEI